MRDIKTSRWGDFLALVAVTAGLSACGGVFGHGHGETGGPADSDSKIQAPAASPLRELLPARVAEAVGFRIAPESRTSAGMPAEPSSGAGHETSNLLIAEDSVIFQDVIHLPDEAGPLFLVWSGHSAAGRVVDARFAFEKFNSDNQKSADYARANASRSPSGDSWFIPLNPILGVTPDPGHTYWLILELVLDSGQIVHLRVGVRAESDVPQVQVTATERSGLPGAPAALVSAGAAGIEVLRERFKNPSRQPIDLWVSLTAAKGILSYWFHSVEFIEEYAPGSFPKSVERSASLEFAVLPDRLTILRERDVRDEIGIVKAESWYRVRLAAGETVSVVWSAKGNPPAPPVNHAWHFIYGGSYKHPVRTEVPYSYGMQLGVIKAVPFAPFCPNVIDHYEVVMAQYWELVGAGFVFPIQRRAVASRTPLADSSVLDRLPDSTPFRPIVPLSEFHEDFRWTVGRPL